MRLRLLLRQVAIRGSMAASAASIRDTTSAASSRETWWSPQKADTVGTDAG